MSASITVPAVAAALLTVPRDCERCDGSGYALIDASDEYGSAGIGHYVESYCPDCRPCVEWITCDDPLEVGSTIHIGEGPTQWSFDQQAEFVYANPTLVLHWRPGVVVATGVITECVPIVDRYTHGVDHLLAHADGLHVWRTYTTDISDQRLDQDWSPTRPCPELRHINNRIGPLFGKADHRNCPTCDGAGTLPRYAVRLTDVEPRP